MTETSLPMTVGASGLEKSRRVAESQQTLTYLAAPNDVNLRGSLFGGVVLGLVDKIAYMCATRHADCPTVTASFDQVDFRSPIEIGEVVTLLGSVNYVGRTSIEVGVRVVAEPVTGGVSRHTNSCYVTMVAVDEKGRPQPVPRLVLEDEVQLRRYRDAVRRKAARTAVRGGG